MAPYNTTPPEAPPEDRAPPPAGLRACAGTGGVRLSWTAAGAGSRYWVFQRRVSAGDLQFSRLGIRPDESTSLDVGQLVDGAQYEYAVSSVTAAGESQLSAAVQVVPGGRGQGSPSCAGG